MKKLTEEEYFSLDAPVLFSEKDIRFNKCFGFLVIGEQRYKFSWYNDLVEPEIGALNTNSYGIGIDQHFCIVNSNSGNFKCWELDTPFLYTMIYERYVVVICEVNILFICLDTLKVEKEYVFIETITGVKIVNHNMTVVFIDDNKVGVPIDDNSNPYLVGSTQSQICYDPIGRMTSKQADGQCVFTVVDAYVQDPANAQAFNRYAYCSHNPLRFTDPTGWTMQGGMKPRNPFHGDWSTSYVLPTHGASDLSNPYYLCNLAFYGNLDGPQCEIGGSGGGEFSMDELIGTYGYQVAYRSNSVYNYSFLSTQLQLIRNWQFNLSRITNKDIRDAGITELNVGMVNYGDGISTSFYQWGCASGQSHTASVWYESIGGNEKGCFSMTILPLNMYENSKLKLAGTLLNLGSLYTAIGAGLHYNEPLGFWRGKNGKFYGLDFNGNRYTGGKLKFGKAVSNTFKKTSGWLNVIGLGVSIWQFSEAESTENRIKYGSDCIIGGLGFAPGGPIISTFWFFGGRELVFQYGKTINELMEAGIDPFQPAFQPFK